jgi:hypothetical protein
VTIGGSIALIVIGAILKFAVSWQPNGIDLPLVGLILMIAGIVGLLIGLFMYANASRTVRRDRYGDRYVDRDPLA